MNKIYFSELPNFYGQEITLHGFVDKIRDLQYVQFVVIRDSSGKVQVTLEKNPEMQTMNEIVSQLTK
jgi:aspartyl-tRNA synthetase